MGRTKAVIEVDGEAMASRVLSTLRSAGCEPVFVYGGNADELADLEVVVEADLHPGEGPVGAVAGVLGLIGAASGEDTAAHRTRGGEHNDTQHHDTQHHDTAHHDTQHRDAAPETPRDLDGCVIVACDLPDLDVSAIRSLVSTAELNPDAVVVAMTDRIEPLCAYWPLRAHTRVCEYFDAGERALHRVIADLDAVTVDVPRAVLRNVNTPADLD